MFKTKVIEYINSFKDKDPKELTKARKQIIEKFKINKSVISRWEKDYENIKESINLNSKRLKGGGRKSTLEDYEKNIILWILQLRRMGSEVTIKEITEYIYALDDEFEDIDYENMRQRVHRFLFRNHLYI